VRPIELTLDGFRSYDTAATFRWSGRRLVGVVGPIGSGKSSILDAISFALYGRTPRIGRSVRALINQRRDQATVEFTFSVDSTVLRVVRSLRRTGQSAHALYRVDGDVEHEEADKAADVTSRIETALGLEFEGFRKSVMLAQGQFAAFLEAGPADRSDVLKGVFGLERLDAMRAAAVLHRQEAAATLQALDAARAALETDRSALAHARADVEHTEQRAASLAALLPEAEALVEQVRAAATARARAEEAIDRLARLAGEVPRREETDTLLGEVRSQAAATAERTKEAVAAASVVEQAERDLAAALDAAGGTESLDEAGVLVTVAGQQRHAVAEATERARAAEAAAERRAAGLAEAVAAEAEAERALAAVRTASEVAAAVRGEAELALHEARHRSMALTLRAELAAGTVCPVCEQVVEELPSTEVAPEVSAAEEAVAEARSADSEAQRGLAAAGAELAAAQARRRAEESAAVEAEQARAAATEAGGRVSAALDATLAALEGLLGPGEPSAVLAERRGAVQQASARLDGARNAAAAAERRRAEAVAAEAERTGALQALVGRVAGLAGRLDVDVTASADPDALDGALGAVRTAWLDRKREADEALAEAESAATAAEGQRAALLAGAGLEPDADVRTAAGGAAAAVEAARRRAADIEARLARLTEMEAAEAATVAARDRYSRLADDLGRARFPAYVLEDRRRMLADLGGDLFDTLSGGRYRFSDDGEFDVVDLAAAEQVRSADSLSGGETFLASLALALALAEIVAREGGRLDAFFLDEGFGSLDPEHLGLAMDGIERLVAMRDRLVVVVSHVEALRDRIEDLVVLDKDPLTGATIVVQGSTGPE